MHIERYGNVEVQGIEFGECFIFPKLDGTNSSVWIDEDVGISKICMGSRNRELTEIDDNAGFYDFIKNDDSFKEFFKTFPNLRLYGEWLVPHSLKTYRDDAWRKFYIFDVFGDLSNEYIPYNDYKKWLDEYNLDYIPPICSIKNGSFEKFIHELENNKFLIQNDKGIGEGIVIKNYGYRNQWGRPCFAKIVNNDFKEAHAKKMGSPVKEFKQVLEQEIANIYINLHFVNKIIDKISVLENGWASKYIPRLLSTAYYDLINEELWNILKKMKNPVINFKTLQFCVTKRVKEIKPELF
jgi:hypothetical protein